ncbi:MAG: magnesium/cobalt transporter CorA [Bacteroidales bacterium]|nr:magnesium/cobalt transporter CorA [Bacteroidales bacterium]
MPRFFKNRFTNRGMAPGSLTFIGNKKMESPHISLIEYSKDRLEEKVLDDLTNLDSTKSTPEISWINIYGIHDAELIQQIGQQFDLQALLLEDIVNTDQRPRFYEGEDSLAFILKVITYDGEKKQITSDQISICLGSGFVLSFQEQKTTVFEVVRERLRNSKGRIRSAGTDYLVYALLDTIIDDYLNVVAIIGEEIESLAAIVLKQSGKGLENQFYTYKTEINFLRKIIRPVKEMIIQWQKSETLLVNKKTRTYLQDLADLVTQAEESIEIYNNLLSDGLNIYNTQLSNRANDIMKVLTIFAAVFIPLTFLAGIYGMNFEYIPELSFRYAYPVFWAVVLLLGGGLLVFFHRKKWL